MHIVITGGTDGIGRATAIALAKPGRRFTLIGRSAERANQVLRELATRGAEGTFARCDLSRPSQVRELATGLSDGAIDRLVLAAGVITSTRQANEDGVELQWAVNHLAAFLLTHLLWPAILRGTDPRIVIVASQVEAEARLDFAELDNPTSYQPLAAYRRSKLANVLFCYELARQAGSGVDVNCLHPGVVRTDLLDAFIAAEAPQTGLSGRLVGRARSALGRLKRRVRAEPPPSQDWAISPAEAAGHVARLVEDPDLQGVSGQYFDRASASESSPQSRDPKAARRLWELSARQLGIDVTALNTPRKRG